MESIKNLKDFKNKTILVTGGTGSWGHELVKQLLENYSPKEIRIYTRGEHRQMEMRREFNNDSRLKFIIGDVRDKDVLDFAMRGVDIVFHLAALKHVPVCEENCWEAVLTNVYGTQNVIECAIRNRVKKVVDASTDKAVEPLNFYGMTKACGERMMVNANHNYSFNNNSTSFVCVRGGNVIGTQGSVIPLFKKQIQTKNEITVTDENMTRFLMNTKEAIGLVIEAAKVSLGGEIFVMKMPATKVGTLARVMIKLFGNSQTKIKKIGIRPGEKVHEVLISKNEICRTKIFSEKYFVILPFYKNEALDKKYQNYKPLKIDEFSSKNTHILSDQELEDMLRKEDWLMK